MTIQRPLRAFAVILLAFAILVPARGDVLAQSKRDVDEAKDQLDEAQEELDFVVDDRDVIIFAFEDVKVRLAEIDGRSSQLRDRLEFYEDQVAQLEERVKARALAAYMAGGVDDLQLFFQAGSYDEVVTGREVMQQAAAKDSTMLDRLTVTKRDMERISADLEADQAEALELSAQYEQLVGALDTLWEDRRGTLIEADAFYREVRAKYLAEVARQRALAEARRKGGSAGISSAITPNFLCPVKGAHRFINDWGFPRSGGRTHKGTDMFAARGTPLVAVANGSVSLRNSGLGGIGVWLRADHGVSYYYAHLDSWAQGLSTGDRVSRGQVIGYVGDSGNARGGAPHNHFQLHPGGGAPVNPYPTLARACR